MMPPSWSGLKAQHGVAMQGRLIERLSEAPFEAVSVPSHHKLQVADGSGDCSEDHAWHSANNIWTAVVCGNFIVRFGLRPLLPDVQAVLNP